MRLRREDEGEMDGDRAGGFGLGFRRVRWAGLGGPREAGGGALAHAGCCCGLSIFFKFLMT